MIQYIAIIPCVHEIKTITGMILKDCQTIKTIINS